MFLVSGRNSRKAIKRDKGYMQWIERGKREKEIQENRLGAL